MEYEQNTKELETNVQESEDIEDRNIEESFQPKKQNVKNKNLFFCDGRSVNLLKTSYSNNLRS